MKLPGIRFIRALLLPGPGIIEFKAWEKAQFMGIEQRDYNGRVKKPHLIYTDCPEGPQITYRMLLIEGQAQVPDDEDWLAMGQCFPTPRSFGTLYICDSSSRKKKVPDRGKTEAKDAKADLIVGLPVASD